MSTDCWLPFKDRNMFMDQNGKIKERFCDEENMLVSPEERARKCSKCKLYLPSTSYEATKRNERSICKTCAATAPACNKELMNPKRRLTWAESLLCFSKFESRKIFHMRFRVKVVDIATLPSTLENGDFQGRLMPLNLLGAEMNSYNTVIVHKDAAEVLRKCMRTGSTDLYRCIMYHYFPGLVTPVPSFSRSKR